MKAVGECKVAVYRQKKKCLIALLVLFLSTLCCACGQPELTTEEQLGVDAVNAIKDDLKNPESLQVHEIEYVMSVTDEDSPEYIFCIDYSAQNGYGGYNRQDAYIKTVGKTILPYDEHNEKVAKAEYTVILYGKAMATIYSDNEEVQKFNYDIVTLDVDKIMSVVNEGR